MSVSITIPRCGNCCGPSCNGISLYWYDMGEEGTSCVDGTSATITNTTSVPRYANIVGYIQVGTEGPVVVTRSNGSRTELDRQLVTGSIECWDGSVKTYSVMSGWGDPDYQGCFEDAKGVSFLLNPGESLTIKHEDPYVCRPGMGYGTMLPFFWWLSATPIAKWEITQERIAEAEALAEDIARLTCGSPHGG